MDRRILIIVQNLPVPLDRRVWLEATTLRRAGYRISVICPRMLRCQRRFEEIDGIRIWRYPLLLEGRSAFGYLLEFSWCWLCTAALSLWIALRGGGFDVIHACCPPDTYFALAFLWKLAGKRFVFDHHDLSPELYQVKANRPRPWLMRLLLWMERLTFRTADVVLSTNDSYAEVARRRGRVRPENLFIVRSAPDIRCFQRLPADPTLKEGYRHLVVYLGIMGPQDGVEVLLHAIAELSQRNDALFVLLGDGTSRPGLEALAHTLGVADRVRFPGFVSGVALQRWLSTADVCVAPDPKNEFNDKCTMNKVAEYMFFGKPVVAFDLVEIRVSAGEAARYAHGSGPQAFAREVAALLDDEDERRRRGALGAAIVRSRLLWEHSEPALLAAYERVFRFLRPAAEHPAAETNERAA